MTNSQIATSLPRQVKEHLSTARRNTVAASDLALTDVAFNPADPDSIGQVLKLVLAELAALESIAEHLAVVIQKLFDYGDVPPGPETVKTEAAHNVPK